MNKVVVVTGASSGLGLSHAIYLTHLGYTVFGTSRNPGKIDLEQLKQVFLNDHTKWRFSNKEKTAVKAKRLLLPKKIKKTLDDLLAKITFFEMDVTIKDSVAKAIDAMQQKAQTNYGRGIDVLINNAGIGLFGSVEETTIEEWQQSFDTNVFGPLRVIKAVLPEMKKRKSGQIINTASLAAYVGIPFQTHYSSTKAAIKIITEGLRVELKPYNIKVSSVLPSDINTNFNRNTLALSKEEEENIQSIDLQKMIDNPPIKERSAYKDMAKATWRVIVQNLIVSPPPMKISKTIARIIKTKKPKINYNAGSISQRLLTFLIRRVVTDEITYSILPKYYGL
jgi:NAD(P)-dependent dehydrogenase (short-subunit alcohol dehydrogenase family)